MMGHRSTGSVTRRCCQVALVALLFGVGHAQPQQPDCPPPVKGKIRPTASSPGAFPLEPGAGSVIRPTASGELPVPAVAIRVRVPAIGGRNRELTYRLLAENTTTATANHVIVRATIPVEAATFVRATPQPDDQGSAYVWKLGSLPPGSRREITLVVQPTGAEEVACCARVQFEHGQCVRTRIGGKNGSPSPVPPPTPPPPPAAVGPVAKPTARGSLEVRLDAPSEAIRYDIITCKLEVRNNGKAAVRDVVVRNTLPKELSYINSKPATNGEDNPLLWKLNEIAPGAARTIEYQVVARESGRLISNIVVEGAGGVKQSTTHTVRVGQPGLSVLKTGPGFRSVSRTAQYQITVSNTGDLPSNHVEISDELPEDIEFVSATDNGQLGSNFVRWNLGTLAPGTRKTVKVVVRAKRAGEFRNVCTATADRGLSEQSRAITTFKADSGLMLEFDKEHDPVAVNQETTVTLRVRNAGTMPETNADVRIGLPEGFKVLEVRGPDRTQTKGPNLHLPILPRIEPGKEHSVVLRLRAEKAGPAQLSALAVTDSTGPDMPVKVDEAIHVHQATVRVSNRGKR